METESLKKHLKLGKICIKGRYWYICTVHRFDRGVKKHVLMSGGLSMVSPLLFFDFFLWIGMPIYTYLCMGQGYLFLYLDYKLIHVLISYKKKIILQGIGDLQPQSVNCSKLSKAETRSLEISFHEGELLLSCQTIGSQEIPFSRQPINGV